MVKKEIKKDWKKRLGCFDSMNEAIFITIDDETIYHIEDLERFIEQEIEKAREQERKRTLEEVRAEAFHVEDIDEDEFDCVLVDTIEEMLSKFNQSKENETK